MTGSEGIVGDWDPTKFLISFTGYWLEDEAAVFHTLVIYIQRFLIPVNFFVTELHDAAALLHGNDAFADTFVEE